MSGRQIPVKINDLVELEIIDINHRGEGIGRYYNFAVFIPCTAVGDIVRAKITETKNNYARGEIIKIIESSGERCSPLCRAHLTCGGCQLQHIDYSLQLKLKKKLVQDNLQRIGGLKNVTLMPVTGMEKPWNYRNKIHLQVGRQNKQTVLGFFAEGSHQLSRDFVQCYIVDERLNEIIPVLEKLLNKYNVIPYNWQTKNGLLRHVILRRAQKTREIMAIFVTGPEKWPEQAMFGQELQRLCPDIVSIIRNINSGSIRLVLGRKNKLLAGKESITDYLDGLAFNISAHSFYQVNPVQTIKLYNQAREYAGLSGRETIIDAYCGIGTIALYLSRYAGQVIGLEAEPSAVKDARENAKLNNIKNILFRCGYVEKLLPELAEQGVSPDLVVLDPPRQGCQKPVIKAIYHMNVPRIVYISCNPSTLARDLKIFSSLGYSIVEVQPVDMFPHTAHVETVALIERE